MNLYAGKFPQRERSVRRYPAYDVKLKVPKQGHDGFREENAGVEVLLGCDVAYEDDAPATMEQYSHDVTHFLTWAADPYMEERKQTGIKVMIFLAVFTGLMYAYKRKIWSNVH